jgi:hypothetical protein
MQFATFASLFAGLLVVLTVVVPISTNFPTGAPLAVSLGSPNPQCLLLAYGPGVVAGAFPSSVRLRQQIKHLSPAGRVWYESDSRGPGVRRGEGFWARAAADSIDIVAWHHAPILRLPITGAMRRGRGGWPGHASLFAALVDRGFTVLAAEKFCPQNW